MFSRYRFVRKEKVVPHRVLGVVALPARSRIMKSVLEWLKNQRLHKYWPIFSRMNYQTIVGLREDNIDQALANINAEVMTNGARGRILRCAEFLRARPAQIDAIDEHTPFGAVCQIFSDVLETPLSAEDEPYGISLIVKLRQKLQFLILHHGVEILRFPGFTEVLISFANKEDIPKEDRGLATRVLRNMDVCGDLPTPTPSRSPSPPRAASSPSVATKDVSPKLTGSTSPVTSATSSSSGLERDVTVQPAADSDPPADSPSNQQTMIPSSSSANGSVPAMWCLLPNQDSAQKQPSMNSSASATSNGYPTEMWFQVPQKPQPKRQSESGQTVTKNSMGGNSTVTVDNVSSSFSYYGLSKDSLTAEDLPRNGLSHRPSDPSRLRRAAHQSERPPNADLSRNDLLCPKTAELLWQLSVARGPPSNGQFQPSSSADVVRNGQLHRSIAERRAQPPRPAAAELGSGSLRQTTAEQPRNAQLPRPSTNGQARGGPWRLLTPSLTRASALYRSPSQSQMVRPVPSGGTQQNKTPHVATRSSFCIHLPPKHPSNGLLFSPNCGYIPLGAFAAQPPGWLSPCGANVPKAQPPLNPVEPVGGVDFPSTEEIPVFVAFGTKLAFTETGELKPGPSTWPPPPRMGTPFPPPAPAPPKPDVTIGRLHSTSLPMGRLQGYGDWPTSDEDKRRAFSLTKDSYTRCGELDVRFTDHTWDGGERQVMQNLRPSTQKFGRRN